MRFLSLRAWFLAAFVVAMPVLALPPVAQRIDEWLYGPPPSDFGRAPPALADADPPAAVTTDLAPPSSVTLSSMAPSGTAPSSIAPFSVAPASFVEPVPRTGGSLAAAPPTSPGSPPISAPPISAPPLAALPASPPFESAPPAAPPARLVPIDERTISRLQQIRQRLEQLGAEYVVVETLESTGRFRFHARMLIDERSRFTRPFEASASDPITAGEQVLREVEAWRSGGPAPVAR
jgi:hypothetical protein